MAKDNVNIITGTSTFDGALIRGNTGFDGVSESNSLVVNDRIMAFRRKLHATENQVGQFTWKTSGNNFILSKDGKNFTISREGYAMQQVSNVSSITPTYSANDPLVVYDNATDPIVLLCKIPQPTNMTETTTGLFYETESNIIITSVDVMLKEGRYRYFGVCRNGTRISYNPRDDSIFISMGFRQTIVNSKLGYGVYLSHSYKSNAELVSFVYVFFADDGCTYANRFQLVSKSPTGHYNTYTFDISMIIGCGQLPEDAGGNFSMPGMTFSIPWVDLWTAGTSRVSVNIPNQVHFNYQFFTYTPELGVFRGASDGVFLQDKTRNIALFECFNGTYSIKYNDDIYLNYVNFVPISISHNGHKLLDLSGNQSEVGISNGYLCAYIEGQWYRFYKTTYTTPQCTELANMLYMFNTTTVKNALFVNSGNITQYDGCCSATRPVVLQHRLEGTGETLYSGVFGGRCNPLWQNGQLRGASDEFSLEEKAFGYSTITNSWTVIFVQNELRGIWNDIPPFYAYFPLSTTAPTIANGAKVKTDSSSYSGFSLDLTDTITVPAVSNPPEIVPALFGVTYSDEATKIYIRVSGSLYPLLFTTLGTSAFVYRLLTEEAIAGGDYTFVIQGGLYTFSGQTQRISSNNKWVCDARGMVFCGHSTRCAYFYCTWDRGLYGFFGDNELKKLISMERFPLPLTNNKVGNFVNIPSIGILMYSSPMGVVVVYNDLEQYCIIPIITDTIKENITNGYITIGNYDYYLSDTTAERQPIELTTQWYGSIDDFTFTEFTGIIIICTNENGGKSDLTVEIGTRDDSGEKWEKIETKIKFTSSGLGWCKIIPKQPRAIGLKLHIISQSDIMGIRVLTQPVDIQRGASK